MKEIVKTINERIAMLKSKYSLEYAYYEDINPNEIILESPEEDILADSIDVELFLKYTANIEELEKIDDTSVRCGKFRQTIVLEGIHYGYNYPVLVTEICKLSIINNPFLVGIIAYKEGYDKDCIFSFYTAVELEYFGDDRLSIEEEMVLIKRYLYRTSTLLGYSISIDKFHNWPDFDKGDDCLNKYRDLVLKENDIPPYTMAMEYYNEAMEASSYSIRYLSFYKVMEYFSPIVSKKEYYEEINKRLDAISIVDRTHDYIDSFYKLTKKYDKSLKDNEIPFTILSNCVDVEMLFDFLPDSIQLKLKKDNGLKKNDGINKKSAEVIKELSDILYSTRNSIVHAKSNYNKTGYECIGEDMCQLNIFMEKLCQCIFIWNGRQSPYYQLK